MVSSGGASSLAAHHNFKEEETDQHPSLGDTWGREGRQPGIGSNVPVLTERACPLGTYLRSSLPLGAPEGEESGRGGPPQHTGVSVSGWVEASCAPPWPQCPA